MIYGTSTYGSSLYGASLGAALAPPAPVSKSLELKLREAAILNSTLTSYLGTAPFRWYDMQESQNSELPSVTVQLISCVNDYTLGYRLNNTLNRVQFTIRDTDAEEARAIEYALVVFLDTFNAYSPAGTTLQRPNYVIMRRQLGNPNTDPLTFYRQLDAYIYNNELQT